MIEESKNGGMVQMSEISKNEYLVSSTEEDCNYIFTTREEAFAKFLELVGHNAEG